MPVDTFIALTAGEGRMILLPNKEKDTLYTSYTTKVGMNYDAPEMGHDRNPYNRNRFGHGAHDPRYKDVSRDTIRR